MSDHTHKQFDAEMEEIRSGVLAMGGLVETQLARAIGALKHPDIDLIASVATDERAINQMQVSIDQQHLLMKRFAEREGQIADRMRLAFSRRRTRYHQRFGAALNLQVV